MDMSLVGRFDELGPAMAREAIDLVELLEPIVKDQQRRFADLAIDFRFGALAAPVRGNPYWLHLAIRELLDNAVRFRPGPTGRAHRWIDRQRPRGRCSPAWLNQFRRCTDGTIPFG